MASIEETLRSLLNIIPGYTGYAAREERREADKKLRMHLAAEYRGVRREIDRLITHMIDNGGIRYADDVGKIGKQLDGFIAELETAPRGYAGWFESAQIDVAELERIYHLDNRLTSDVPLLRERITYTATQFAAGEGFDEALAELRSFIDELRARFAEREAYLVQGQRPDLSQPMG